MGPITSIKGPIYCAQTGLETFKIILLPRKCCLQKQFRTPRDTQSPIYLGPLQPAVVIQLAEMRPIADTLL
jgi:hypothetical protein